MAEQSAPDIAEASEAGCNIVPGSRLTVNELDGIAWDKCGLISDLTIVLSSDNLFGHGKDTSLEKPKAKVIPMKPKHQEIENLPPTDETNMTDPGPVEVPSISPDTHSVSATPAANVPSMVHPVPGADGVSQILQNLPAGSSLSGLSVVLATVAILGGGTAFKFYTQLSKQRHAEKMKSLEHENTSNEDNKKRCEGHAAIANEGISNLKKSLEEISSTLKQVVDAVRILDTRVCKLESSMDDVIDLDMPESKPTKTNSSRRAKPNNGKKSLPRRVK